MSEVKHQEIMRRNNIKTDFYYNKSHQQKEVNPMNVDRSTKVILCIIAVLLFLNFAQKLLDSKPVFAAPENNATGRYQISSWAAYGGALVHHNGYYVVDTFTGKIVDQHSEMHPAPR
jgi:hypothetical protein